MIVADTNLVAYLLIEGEGTAGARKVWKKDAEWLLPPLWRSEFLNVLALAARTELIGRDDAREGWFRATSLFHGREGEPEGVRVLESALDRGISAYDAQFVVVAEANGVPLVTADREVLQACPEIAVSPEAFVG